MKILHKIVSIFEPFLLNDLGLLSCKNTCGKSSAVV